MKEIYGGFYDRYGYEYLENFEDYDPETERKECCECNYIWDEDDDFSSNNERRRGVYEYLSYVYPFDNDDYENVHPYWNGGV